MKKLSLLIVACSLLLGSFAIIKIKQPNKNEVERYQALLCFIIRKTDVVEEKSALMKELEKYQQGSISDYAVQHPDFRPSLAEDWVERYLHLSNIEKQQAKQDYNHCVSVLKQ